jgi:hypothetical protein
MVEINRRGMMVAGAGAGAAILTGCDGASVTGGPEPEAVDCEPFGFPTDTDGKAHFNKPNDPTFKPQYVCLVYLRFADAKLVARHAYYDIAGYDAAGDDKAKTEWARKRLGSAATGKWDADGLWKPEDNFPNPRENFEGFDFGSQQIVYFTIDNEGSVSFDPNNGIRFSSYATKTGRPTARSPQKPKVDKNSAFFSARIVADNLLYLENWFTAKDGRRIDKQTDPKYQEMMSMDIHLLMATADGKGQIPIVIDPDTHNGTARKP